MKPVSYKTVKALEFLESHGPASATEIAKEISASMGSTYRRMGIAVKHGMAARNFEEIPYRYSAATGWRDIVAKREAAVEVKTLARRNFVDLKIEYVACPRIVGPVAGTVWQGMGA